MKLEYFLSGRVRKGDGVGRKIGYPTANLTRHYFNYHPRANGIYAGFAKIGKKEFPATAIIGVDEKIEIHIMSRIGNIYGRTLTFMNVKKLRPLKTFTSDSLLKKQIKKDLTDAKKILGLR